MHGAAGALTEAAMHTVVRVEGRRAMVTERLLTDHALPLLSGAWERPSVSRVLQALGECGGLLWCCRVEGEMYTRQQQHQHQHQRRTSISLHRHCITKLFGTVEH
jgi:hypothetical protein